MLPYLTPDVPNAALSATPTAQQLNASPILLPPQSRGEGHSRSYPKPGITVKQTNRMPLHILLVATGLDSPVAARTAPRNTPGLSAPKRKAGSQKQVVCPRKLWQTSCLSLHASRLAAACRLRQSCRIARACPRPSTRRTPRQSSVHVQRLCRSPRPEDRHAISRKHQRPHTPDCLIIRIRS